MTRREGGLRYTFEYIQNLTIIYSAVPSSIDPFKPVMTRAHIPSSRFSSEFISPLNLDSGLTTRLHAASFQHSISNCAVLTNSTALGNSVLSSLLSVAEERLASPSEHISSEVGTGHDKVRLTQPGKLYYEEKSFLRLRGDDDDDRGLVSGARLLTELTQSVDAPSVQLFSSSESFSPSTFMGVYTRAGLSTFSGVSQPGGNQDRSSNLRSCSGIKIPSRYLHTVSPAKSKRTNKCVADVLVRLLFSNPAMVHRGGKVGRGVNFQSCVSPSYSCLVSSHATKAETFECNRLYILTPSKSGRVTVYLDPLVSTEDMTAEVLNFLLAQELSVKFWSSFLLRTISCSVVEIGELITSLDGSSKRLSEFITPKKRLKVDPSLTNLAISFPFDPFQSFASGFSFDQLWPQLRDRIFTLSQTVILL